MDIIHIEDPIRVLAKSYYWQAVYHRCKDLPGNVELFENNKDFTNIQLRFLQYLEQISGMYQDLAMGEKLLCDQSINDELRANAYLIYRGKHREDKQVNNVNSNQSGDRLVGIPRKKVN
jgi:hypothetical protein